MTTPRLDMKEAIKATFTATLDKRGAKDEQYAAKFDHLWCAGHYQCRGPRGGVYFVGRAVMRAGQEPPVKGTLRLANARFLELMQGGETPAWFTPDGAATATCIGTLVQYDPR